MVAEMDLHQFFKSPTTKPPLPFVVALCLNDAKYCYDQVVHSVASIMTQHQNIPESACLYMFTTLQNMQHTICTVYSESKAIYGDNLWLVPHHGLGQGNGAGGRGRHLG
jgi:hypothetical protein